MKGPPTVQRKVPSTDRHTHSTRSPLLTRADGGEQLTTDPADANTSSAGSKGGAGTPTRATFTHASKAPHQMTGEVGAVVSLRCVRDVSDFDARKTMSPGR